METGDSLDSSEAEDDTEEEAGEETEEELEEGEEKEEEVEPEEELPMEETSPGWEEERRQRTPTRAGKEKRSFFMIYDLLVEYLKSIRGPARNGKERTQFWIYAIWKRFLPLLGPENPYIEDMKINYGKRYLLEAFIQMAKTRKLSEITITDLVRKAGVNRSIFYRNFKNVEDVLHEYFAVFIRDAMEACPEGSSALGFYFRLAEGYWAKKEELCAIHSREMEAMMSEVYWDFLFNVDELDYVLSFYCGGLNLVFLSWYHFKFRENLQDFQKKIKEMVVSDYPIHFFENRRSKKD